MCDSCIYRATKKNTYTVASPSQQGNSAVYCIQVYGTYVIVHPQLIVHCGLFLPTDRTPTATVVGCRAPVDRDVWTPLLGRDSAL